MALKASFGVWSTNMVVVKSGVVILFIFLVNSQPYLPSQIFLIFKKNCVTRKLRLYLRNFRVTQWQNHTSMSNNNVKEKENKKIRMDIIGVGFWAKYGHIPTLQSLKEDFCNRQSQLQDFS